MTGASIKVDDRAVKKALRELRRKTRDTLPVMRAIGHAVKTHVDLNFRGQHAPDGKRWADLSDTTKDRRKGTSYHILRDSAVLANSITIKSTKTRTIVGTNVIYAGTQQFGAKKGQYGRMQSGAPIPWGDIPARPFIPVDGLPKDLRDDIMDLLEKHIDI